MNDTAIGIITDLIDYFNNVKRELSLYDLKSDDELSLTDQIEEDSLEQKDHQEEDSDQKEEASDHQEEDSINPWMRESNEIKKMKAENQKKE